MPTGPLTSFFTLRTRRDEVKHESVVPRLIAEPQTVGERSAVGSEGAPVRFAKLLRRCGPTCATDICMPADIDGTGRARGLLPWRRNSLCEWRTRRGRRARGPSRGSLHWSVSFRRQSRFRLNEAHVTGNIRLNVIWSEGSAAAAQPCDSRFSDFSALPRMSRPLLSLSSKERACRIQIVAKP